MKLLYNKRTDACILYKVSAVIYEIHPVMRPSKQNDDCGFQI